MTFEEQIESLTGLTISSSGTNPTQDEISQFLKDGIVDVISKIIQLRPDEIVKFCTTTNSGSSIKKQGFVFSVLRGQSSTTTLRPCTPMSAQDRYEATDKDSLKYRSAYNPGYYELDGHLHTIPAADSDSNIYVTQIFYDKNSLYSDSSISNFPSEYEYLVAIYAGVKALEAKMAEYTIDEEDTELTQAISVNLSVLQKQYNEAFGLMGAVQKNQAKSEAKEQS